MCDVGFRKGADDDWLSVRAEPGRQRIVGLATPPRTAENLEVLLSGGLPEGGPGWRSSGFGASGSQSSSPGKSLQITWLTLETRATSPR